MPTARDGPAPSHQMEIAQRPRDGEQVFQMDAKSDSPEDDANRDAIEQEARSAPMNVTGVTNTSSVPASVGAGAGSVPVHQIQLRDPSEAPVRKLSVNLIRTYKSINQVYYENKRKRQQQEAASAAAASTSSGTLSNKNRSTSKKISKQSRLYNDGHDDEHSDYIIRIGEKIEGRYIVKQKIGKGSFGQVVRAFDEVRNENVAIKIIKSRRPFFQQAKTEIGLLQELNEKDPGDKWFIVRLLSTFVHHNHQCLVFEMLSYNLYDLLRNTQFYGVSLNLIRKFARQILKALYFLARDDVDIVHCDLKPENILLRHPKRSAIKVIDFGSSCKSDKQCYSYIQSRFYRSPEVILGRSYSVAIDMWSLGCILVEMHTGEPLFSGTDEHDQILRLVAIRGMPPDEILNTASKTHKFFEPTPEGSRPAWKLKPRLVGDSAEGEVTRRKKTLQQILGLEGSGPASRRANEQGHSPEMYTLFIDLVEKMLTYDPEQRIDPKNALNHPFMLSDSQKVVCRQKVKKAMNSLDGGEARNYYAKRPGSAPATAVGGNQTLRRSSRVAKQGIYQGVSQTSQVPTAAGPPQPPSGG